RDSFIFPDLGQDGFSSDRPPAPYFCLKSLTSAPARAASQGIARRPCRRRPARAQRTTTGVVPAGAGSALGFACSASVISALGPHLAAEDPIGPRRISQNERHQHGDAEQHEDLAVLRRGRLPDG